MSVIVLSLRAQQVSVLSKRLSVTCKANALFVFAMCVIYNLYSIIVQFTQMIYLKLISTCTAYEALKVFQKRVKVLKTKPREIH